MIENYLQMLKESMQSKLSILEQIELKSKEQENMLKKEECNLMTIDQNMDEKAELIKQLELLDKGFETLYEKIKQELLINKERYTHQIRDIQELISSVMEKSATIEAVEARNKITMEKKFKNERKDIRVKKTAVNAAYNYYQVANKLNITTPQFLDKKK